MPCRTIKNDKGEPFAIVCSRGSYGKPKQCTYCGKESGQLCDGKLPAGDGAERLCSVPLCRRCSYSPRPDKDYCLACRARLEAAPAPTSPVATSEVHPIAPAPVCDCPCGCRVELTVEVARITTERCGVPRCRDCFPGRAFNAERHADLPTLGIPKAPDLTAADVVRLIAAKWPTSAEEKHAPA